MGSLRQTLEGHSNEITVIAFSPDDKQLETESGLVELQDSETNVSSLLPQHIYDIFIKDDWIVRDNKRVLWLSFEYRKTCLSVQESKLVLGYTFGRITLLAFNFPKLNQ